MNEYLFDPTAFDNMKVILEGAVYDRDFYGDILVIKRDDLMNLATLSRQYSVEFELKEPRIHKKVSGGIRLSASLENLSSELLAGYSNESSNGSTVEIFVNLLEQLTKEQAVSILTGLAGIWGEQRSIAWTTVATMMNTKQESFSSTFTISFDRLVKEDQIDDLVDMIEYLIQSLQWMETFFKKGMNQ